MATRSPPGSPPAQPLAGYSSPNNFTTVSPPGPTPYPDAAYPAQPVITDQAPQTIVVVTPPPINPNPVFRYGPVVVRCQFCHIDVLTMVYPKVGCFTWVACLFISFCGSLTAILAFWFFSFNMGCCLIPFCVDECQDAIHVCPNCRREIARYVKTMKSKKVDFSPTVTSSNSNTLNLGTFRSSPAKPRKSVVVTQPSLASPHTVRDRPVRVDCHFCQYEGFTRVQPKAGCFTCLCCLLISLVGGNFGCCLIPFCLDECKDAVHICPNCQQEVARFERIHCQTKLKKKPPE